MKLTRRALLGAPAFIRTLKAESRPNILFAIADDWSYPHCGAGGDRVVRTPAFDEVAGRGVLFTTAIAGSPGCAPSRASLLTGRPHWQLEEAGTHASYFPKKLQVFPDLLKNAGYHVGVTGKGAGPCAWKESGWPHNPAGPDYSRIRAANAPKGMSNIDYAANFDEFLSRRSGRNQPFFFWYGGSEPHRVYEQGAGERGGKRIADVKVPGFLPDNAIVRGDILDYYNEIEYFDTHLNRMLRALERAGELENTIVMVTGDNGMPFPAAKATTYDYGIHVPLAVSWGSRLKGGRTNSDPVSFIDFAPTFLEAAGVRIPPAVVGRSMLVTFDKGSDPARRFVLSGRERHSHARFDNLGYPSRALRTPEHLYIRNFAPERWPAGDPPLYADIDASPTKEYIVINRENPEVQRFAELALGKNGPEQLYDIREDPACTRNLAALSEYKKLGTTLRTDLDRELERTRDPRVLGKGDIWESYPRFSPMRPQLGGFAEQGKPNPKYRSGSASISESAPGR